MLPAAGRAVTQRGLAAREPDGKLEEAAAAVVGIQRIGEAAGGVLGRRPAPGHHATRFPVIASRSPSSRLVRHPLAKLSDLLGQGLGRAGHPSATAVAQEIFHRTGTAPRAG